MYSIKRIPVFVFISVLVVFLLSACSSNLANTNMNDNVIFNKDGIKVTEVPILNPVAKVNSEWLELTEQNAYSDNDVILSGVIQNVREVAIEYTFMDANVTDYIRLFDVSINNIIYSSDSELNRSNNIITVGIPYSSYNTDISLPLVEEGKEFLFFAMYASNIENDLLQLAGYVDLWITSPNKLLLEKLDGNYLSDEFFVSYSSSSVCLESIFDFTEESLKQENENNENSILMEHFISKDYPDFDNLWRDLSKTYIIESNDLETAINHRAMQLKEWR